MASKKALVLLSGGQDSTICLGWALERFDSVETIAFDYGQRHHIELEARLEVLKRIGAIKPEWSRRLSGDHSLVLTELGRISETSLTREAEIVISESGLPSTFVPGRNLIFLTYAAAVAYRRGIATLVGGMCETDYSGYPDCRNDTLDSLERTLSLGMDQTFEIQTPLMFIDKAATWKLAQELGGDALVALIIEHTHTCYIGDRTKRNSWGYGCGECPACELRAKGYDQWQADMN
jgi:7-cyano-7-deazaguanine synthase